MISNDNDALQHRLDALRARIEQIDAMEARSLRKTADECWRLARECRQKLSVEDLADQFEALAVDIAMELDERTAAQLLDGQSSGR